MTILGGWVTGWATSSHEQAVRNARRATTICSRRRVEREEVALYLARLAAGRADDGVHEQGTASAAPRGLDSLSG